MAKRDPLLVPEFAQLLHYRLAAQCLMSNRGYSMQVKQKILHLGNKISIQPALAGKQHLPYVSRSELRIAAERTYLLQLATNFRKILLLICNVNTAEDSLFQSRNGGEMTANQNEQSVSP